ncbi:MAG: hypothetical protein FWH06_02600 [Oscillospiraceae bacterium]|nr:hypothetical protein [Oscillospiraceae bacterium]
MTLPVLVTSGGTRENIDAVRCITNRSTGLTGAAVADRFTRAGAGVVYVCGETAAVPALEPRELIRVGSAAGLSAAIEALLRREAFGCVIHSMAVSDYTPRAVMTRDELRAELHGAPDAARRAAPGAGKISSDSDELFIALERAPKVIPMIKRLQPETLLVGFKLLAGASEPELIGAARALMDSSGCDLVLANDVSGIRGGRHEAFLTDGRAVLRRAATKSEIAVIIYDCVMERLT